jgi:hypothetical protein
LEDIWRRFGQGSGDFLKKVAQKLLRMKAGGDPQRSRCPVPHGRRGKVFWATFF